MTAAPLSLSADEKALENEDVGAGWRFPVIKSAEEPEFPIGIISQYKRNWTVGIRANCVGI
jgi:hypothetical protein